jgi:hypothetical protein
MTSVLFGISKKEAIIMRKLIKQLTVFKPIDEERATKAKENKDRLYKEQLQLLRRGRHKMLSRQ